MIVYRCTEKEDLEKCKQKAYAAKPITIGIIESNKKILEISTW